jgi:hypothetical protein
MLWQIYLRKGLVYVPTVAEIEPGFYRVIETVEVVSAQDLRIGVWSKRTGVTSLSRHGSEPTGVGKMIRIKSRSFP